MALPQEKAFWESIRKDGMTAFDAHTKKINQILRYKSWQKSMAPITVVKTTKKNEQQA